MERQTATRRVHNECYWGQELLLGSAVGFSPAAGLAKVLGGLASSVSPQVLLLASRVREIVC